MPLFPIRTPGKTAAHPSDPGQRPVTGAFALRRAREAAIERGALAAFGLMALTVSGFAGYAISTTTRPYDVRAVLPAQAGPFAWKKTVAQGRAAEIDLDPTTTGSIPDEPRKATLQASTEPPFLSGGSAYRLRQVADGVAILDGEKGRQRVTVGAALPGAGRVLSIRNTGAGWVVITSETIIGPERL